MYRKSYRRYTDSITGQPVVEEVWGTARDEPCFLCGAFEGGYPERLAMCALAGVPCGGMTFEPPYEEEGEYKLTPQDEINNGQQFFSFDRYHG
jgi:hypothetical protein